MHDAPKPEDASAAPALGPAGRVLFAVCKYLAIAGGLVFVATGRHVDRVDHRPQALLVAGARRRRDAADVRGVRVGVRSSRIATWCNGDVKVDFFTHNLAPAQGRVAGCVRLVARRPVRRADRVAHRRRRVGGQGSRRDVGDPGLARVDRAGADGAGLPAARRGGILHVRSPSCASRFARTSTALEASRLMTGIGVGFDHLRRDAGADGGARADRHRDVHRSAPAATCT